MKPIVLAFCFFILSVASVADDVKMPVQLDNTGFRTVLADAGKVFISGQPTMEGLKRMKAKGVTTIVSFRTPHEMDNRETIPFDEAAEAEKLGLKFIHIPLGGEDYPYTPEAVATFAAAMEKLEGKALVHCASAYRASHVWSAYLTKYHGMEVNEAVAHGRAANMGIQPVEALLGGVRYSISEPKDAGAQK